jgi:hypothetical protein
MEVVRDCENNVSRTPAVLSVEQLTIELNCDESFIQNLNDSNSIWPSVKRFLELLMSS